MYVGKLVEMAETEELFQNPMHPYTEALLSAVPKPDPRVGRSVSCWRERWPSRRIRRGLLLPSAPAATQSRIVPKTRAPARDLARPHRRLSSGR